MWAQLWLTFRAGAADRRSMGLPCSSTSLPSSSNLKGAGPPVLGGGTAPVLEGAVAEAPAEDDRTCTMPHKNQHA